MAYANRGPLGPAPEVKARGCPPHIQAAVPGSWSLVLLLSYGLIITERVASGNA